MSVWVGHLDLGDTSSLGLEFDMDVVVRYRLPDPRVCPDGGIFRYDVWPSEFPWGFALPGEQ